MAASSFSTSPFLISALLLSFLLIFHSDNNIRRAAAVRVTTCTRPSSPSSSTSTSSSSPSSSTSTSTSSCVHEQSRNVIRRCARLISKTGASLDEPSAECCDAVRKAKLLPCLCSYITRDMEDLVDVGKVVGVFASCGKTVRPGTKCASVTLFQTYERRGEKEAKRWTADGGLPN
ncbi:unnamed protein product [Linum tenue]|uniref:Bifunctional inhibitor/plant lipid transfer protein/seed storage helical domain-containing protein n=1 Tax=Linum tenue TaxID=586396 RepID=A0AAV0QRE3_9ROSI|nr:unnamed protein product [Linum tenue]